MGVLAGTWATTGIVLLNSPPGATSGALGTQLLLTSGAMAVAAAMAFAKGAVLPGAVIAGASLRFAITGIYELTDVTAWERAAGWVGLALAVLAAAVAATLGVTAARRERGRNAGRALRGPASAPRLQRGARCCGAA